MDYPDSGLDLLSNSSSSSDAEGDSWFQIFWYFVLFVVVIYLCEQGETALPCCAPMHVKCTTRHLYARARHALRMMWWYCTKAGGNCIEEPRREEQECPAKRGQRAGAGYVRGGIPCAAAKAAPVMLYGTAAQLCTYHQGLVYAYLCYLRASAPPCVLSAEC